VGMSVLIYFMCIVNAVHLYFIIRVSMSFTSICNSYWIIKEYGGDLRDTKLSVNKVWGALLEMCSTQIIIGMYTHYYWVGIQ
jgi:hypothetical protein